MASYNTKKTLYQFTIGYIESDAINNVSYDAWLCKAQKECCVYVHTTKRWRTYINGHLCSCPFDIGWKSNNISMGHQMELIIMFNFEYKLMNIYFNDQ